MRLIDADKLKECAIACNIHNGTLTDLCVPLYQINNAPTVDCTWIISGKRYGKKEEALKYLRPKGKWNEIQAGLFCCPFCGARPHQDFKNFCSNCGADMRKEADNESKNQLKSRNY